MTAKSKPMMNLVSRTVEKSSMSLSSSASNSPVTLKAQSQNVGLIASAGRLAAEDSNEDAASSSQAWQSDVKPSLSARRPAATGKTQRIIDKDWPHNFEVSASVGGHLETLYWNLRQKIGRQPGDEMLDLNVNLFWRLYICATMHAAVHLGHNYQENLHSTRKTKERKIKQLFDVSQKLISNQEEIYGISTMNWDTQPLQRTTLLNDRAVQLSTAKVFVFSDSVLCLGKIHQHLPPICSKIILILLSANSPKK